MEQRFSEKAGQGIEISDYPEVDGDDVQFPEYVPVAYAVSVKECGCAEFIVEGSTQICEYCGTLMYRVATRWYRLLSLEEEQAAEEWQKNEHKKMGWVEVGVPKEDDNS